MKKCELCEKVARMYCNSDQASLCWDCDSRVHAANFLVSKHIRTLLCHACQSPTSWTGSGPKLGPTVSVCEACVNGRDRNIYGDRDPGNENSENDDSEDEEEKSDDDEENGDCDNHEEDDDDDSENQVVPLSPPPLLASTSSSSEESSSRRDGFPRSNLGFFKAKTTVETARFSYNGVERPEEKNGTQNIRSWAWR
ncbi:hypothetical protein DH2020_017353 [Rehmannia glutinosa]|uniref:B box-type domain-containing protein n=1 Tax=Rehmannia glutinosa TaxID=99300 RepID=A0ABR0WQM9_REHGL